jgi:hypothetical protein
MTPSEIDSATFRFVANLNKNIYKKFNQVPKCNTVEQYVQLLLFIPGNHCLYNSEAKEDF